MRKKTFLCSQHHLVDARRPAAVGSGGSQAFDQPLLSRTELDFPQGGKICQAQLTQRLKLEHQRMNPFSYETNMDRVDKLARTLLINTVSVPHGIWQVLFIYWLRAISF